VEAAAAGLPLMATAAAPSGCMTLRRPAFRSMRQYSESRRGVVVAVDGGLHFIDSPVEITDNVRSAFSKGMHHSRRKPIPSRGFTDYRKAADLCRVDRPGGRNAKSRFGAGSAARS
jgi:hypothetical protein